MLGEIDRNRKPIKPQYFLAKPNREIISKLSEIFNDNMNVKLNDVSELSFSLPYFIDKHHKLKPNKNVELIKERYLIKVVTGVNIEWFIVNDISDNLDDSDIMNVKCYSLVRELSDKLIKSYEVVSYGADKVIQDMLRMGNTIWNIDYIDADFKASYRSFEFPSSTVLEAIYSIAEVYNAIVTFDTDTRTLSMTKPELTGINMGLTVSYGKLMKSMGRNRSSEEMVTRLSASGKDGLGIQKVNPTGQNYIENYGYWIYPFKRDANKTVISSSHWMSDSLCHALLDYEALVESKTGLFKQYLEELEGYETQLNQLKIDLNKLQQDEKVVQEVTLAQQFGDKMFFEKYSHSGSTSRTFKLNKGYNYAAMIKVDSSSGVTVALNGSVKPVTSGRWTMLGKLNNLETTTITVNGSSTGVFMQVATISIEEYQMAGNDVAIVERYSLDNKENQINLKQIEVSNKLNQITDVQNRTKALQVLLDSENNFTSEQLYELNPYMINKDFSDDVYIDEQDLYDAAMEKFKELQVPQLAVEIDIVNFLEIIEEQRNWKKLNLGDFVNVKYEPLGIELTARISEISYDFGGSSIKLTLSNAKNVNDESTRLEKYLKDTKNTNVVVSNGRPDWTKAVVDTSEMSRLFDNFWNKITNEINMASNEFVELSRTGLTIYDPDDPLRFLRGTHGTLALTRSGGLKYETAISADGVIAEMVLGKIILGSRVVIQDDSGVFTIEGSKLMIDDRCGRPVLRLGLTSEQPDVFGLHVNRYASNNCNDRTITNISGMDNSRGFYIDKIRNGVTSNVLGLSLDGNFRLRVGDDNEVIVINEFGLGIGSEIWQNSPFRVNYLGECWLESLWAENAYITNSKFENGELNGNKLTLRDGGNLMKLWPREGFWAGSEAEGADDPMLAPMWIKMDGTAIFKKLVVTDKNNTLLIDSEKKYIDFGGFDAIGIGALDAELIAANMLTAQDGIISNLTAGKLSTLTNAAIQGWSDYVRIEGNSVKWITGRVTGAGSQKQLSDGRKLYWTTSEQMGLMTVEETAWPVMVYNMEEKIKRETTFEGSGDAAQPVEKIGTGDGGADDRAKMVNTKYNGGYKQEYKASNTARLRSIDLRDDGISLKSEGGEVNITMDSFNVLAAKTVKIGTESGSYIEITQNGDININSTRNVKINGTRIDLN
ncbi:phage tail protein [Paenibacillus barcinonensis]|uniref:Phage tail protein n=1 Tax=Paenibacillus barcinonensis TaxID=198119 RepID=A0A2V4W8K7_PAEBA|nr:phage tail spike protein [Paenibacillus barcinonensis]PYE51653.1 tail protein (putative endopeptidase) [Paenibacillus barcinonensis]QKS56014.1 phage tail protein [Paenibacillus barcinonensis]